MANYKVSKTSKLELIEHHEATGTETTFTFTFNDIVGKYSKLILICDIIPTAAFILQMTINGLSAAFYTTGTLVDSSTNTAITSANASQLQLASATINSTADQNLSCEVNIFYNHDSATKQWSAHSVAHGSSEQAYEDSSLYVATDITTFTAILVKASTSSWKAGTKLTLYGLKI